MPAKKKTAAKKKVAKKTPSKKKAVSKKKTASTTSPQKKAAVSKKKASKAAASKSKEESKAKATAKPRKTSGSDFKSYTPYPIKKGEEYMNEDQVAHFTDILNNWKKELMEEVDRTVHHMQDEAANFPDPNDRATQESEFAMELRTRDRERKLIKKIDESLSMLENGDYGYCEQCGIEIGIRRLEARPTATLCIDCKSLDEILEKTRA